MSPSEVRTRRVVVVDNSHVARRVGERIRQARVRANLTQRQLAEGRYTAAYVSALERGLAKPSMAALTFLSERLGVSVPDLVAADRPAASRLEADLLLASGAARDALDRYGSLLDEAGDDRRNRAELLRGRAEALVRLDRGREAIAPASEAAELFDAIAAPGDAALARYWLAAGQFQADNPAEARSILERLLADERGGLHVSPDFRFRLLTALAHAHAWDGHTERAVTYMEEARGLIGEMSARQRAAFLSGLALQYRRLGDLERAIRVGHESLALYRFAEAEREEAALEINLALAMIELGTEQRAEEHLRRARDISTRYEDARLESEVAEAEAQLALGRNDETVARARADEAVRTGLAGGSYLAAVGGYITLARLARRIDDRGAAEEAYRAAASLLERHGAATRQKDVYAEWADLRASAGDQPGAHELYAAALGRRSGIPSRP